VLYGSTTVLSPNHGGTLGAILGTEAAAWQDDRNEQRATIH
jgi:hypothetical protein